MQQNQGKNQQIGSINQVPSSHSLSADIATGWRPKVKVIGPMPLNFDNMWFDARIREVYASQASFFSIIYLGSRPLNSFAMHDYRTRQYKYKYDHLLNTNYSHLKAFFHKFYTQFQPQTKRPFVGMNPYIKDHNIIFDSHFQSGNLDCVVKVKDQKPKLIYIHFLLNLKKVYLKNSFQRTLFCIFQSHNINSQHALLINMKRQSILPLRSTV